MLSRDPINRVNMHPDILHQLYCTCPSSVTIVVGGGGSSDNDKMVIVSIGDMRLPIVAF